MGARQLNAVAFLGRQSLFQDLPMAELTRLAGLCEVRKFSRGDLLFTAGQDCAGLYLVADGQVKLSARSDSGQEKVIEVIGDGDCVGDAMMFAEAARGVQASALTDTTVLLVPRQVMLRELESNPGLALRMLTGLSRRLNGLVREIEAVTLHSGVKRVVDYLLRDPALPAEAAPRIGAHTVSLPASKGTIASLLSVTPEHFSRILHDLQAKGLIAVQRRDIRILDMARLATYA
jgi:CRP-like cAMP-binding protein